MGLALREAKEAGAALAKIRMGSLNNFQQIANLKIESEANQLASIFAAIILNMRLRLDEQQRQRTALKPPRRTKL